MNDRELLELAAKAGGIEGGYGCAPDDYYYDGNTEGILTYLPDGQMYVWNPLTDDGDALRLAVKLLISVSYDTFSLVVMAMQIDKSVMYGERLTSDINAATRRVIVRAAAEIGRAMP